jgi:predicted metal-dependent hydrolase
MARVDAFFMLGPPPARRHHPFPVQMDFLTGLFPPHRRDSRDTLLAVEQRLVPLEFIRNSRARHYILRLTPDGIARVTIPWGGTKTQAHAFAKTKTAWLARQLERVARRRQASEWKPGSKLLFRGEWETIAVRVDHGRQRVEFGEQAFILRNDEKNLKLAIERRLRSIAEAEIPPLVHAAARDHQVQIAQVQIRNQRSRWGSCSSRGTISLNWRLIQIPPFVRDYLIVHELMHVREMNHSDRYWAHVAGAFPDYAKAERWLDTHSELLR